MGLFDKIKDNAKTISMKAIESTEYEVDEVTPSVSAPESPVKPEPKAEPQEQAPKKEQEPSPTTENKEEKKASDKVEVKKEEKPDAKPAKKEKAEEKPTRHSKVTEVPKQKTSSVSVKSDSGYTPHYKSSGKKEDAKSDKSPAKSGSQARPKNQIVDVSQDKPIDNAKRALVERERATLTVMATQRKLNGITPIFSTTHLKFRTRVYVNRIEYSGGFGKTVIPIERVSWVKVRQGGTGIIIETTEDKRVVLVVKPADRLAFTAAVMKVQGMKVRKPRISDDRTLRLDQLEKLDEGIDEIEKLARLHKKGIITNEEFDAKKKQILGI